MSGSCFKKTIKENVINKNAKATHLETWGRFSAEEAFSVTRSKERISLNIFCFVSSFEVKIYGAEAGPKRLGSRMRDEQSTLNPNYARRINSSVGFNVLATETNLRSVDGRYTKYPFYCLLWIIARDSVVVLKLFRKSWIMKNHYD